MFPKTSMFGLTYDQSTVTLSPRNLISLPGTNGSQSNAMRNAATGMMAAHYS